MKLLVTCFTLIVFATNCNSKKTALSNSDKNTSQKSEVIISYSAHTRGFFQEFILKQNELTEFKDYEKYILIMYLVSRSWEDDANLFKTKSETSRSFCSMWYICSDFCAFAH